MTARAPADPALIHEALHAASIVADIIERHLVAHPAIAGDDGRWAPAQRAAVLVGELYQALGRDLPFPSPPTSEDPSCPTSR